MKGKNQESVLGENQENVPGENQKSAEEYRPVRLKKYIHSFKKIRRLARKLGCLHPVSKAYKAVYNRQEEGKGQPHDCCLSTQGDINGDSGILVGMAHANKLFCPFALLFEVDSFSISHDDALGVMLDVAKRCAEQQFERVLSSYHECCAKSGVA